MNQPLSLQMKGEYLDTYISTFENLRQKAEWGRDVQGTILLFRRGLKGGLTRAIIETTHPRWRTMDEWCDAALAQHDAYVKKKGHAR